MALGSRKDSTLLQYTVKWQRFLRWCSAQDIAPTRVSVQQVADYLVKLFNDGLSVATIRAYKSAIAQTLQSHGRQDISDDGNLKKLVRSFTLDRPRSVNTFPKWDLSLVLHFLTDRTFEPMGTSDMKWCSYKTLFLLLLASGRRRSEVHAIDATRIMWKEDKSEVWLWPVKDFIPKILSTAEGGERFTPMKIRALTKLIGPAKNEPDRLLCPLRALRYYVKRTEPVRGNRKNLFLPWRGARDKVLHKNTLSPWIKNLIKLAYDGISEEQKKLRSISTHEIRAIAASLRVQCNFELETVLSACMWKQHTTFSEFYLRDMTYLQGENRRLGPVVSAGGIVNMRCHIYINLINCVFKHLREKCRAYVIKLSDMYSNVCVNRQFVICAPAVIVYNGKEVESPVNRIIPHVYVLLMDER